MSRNGGDRRPPALSGRACGQLVAVELEEVVGGGDEPPFASAGRPAAALEASDRAVELDLAEHGLDGDLAAPVKRAALRCGQDASHEAIDAAGPARPGVLAQPGIGRNEDGHAVADDVFHLALMPV